MNPPVGLCALFWTPLPLRHKKSPVASLFSNPPSSLTAPGPPPKAFPPAAGSLRSPVRSSPLPSPPPKRKNKSPPDCNGSATTTRAIPAAGKNSSKNFSPGKSSPTMTNSAAGAGLPALPVGSSLPPSPSWPSLTPLPSSPRNSAIPSTIAPNLPPASSTIACAPAAAGIAAILASMELMAIRSSSPLAGLSSLSGPRPTQLPITLVALSASHGSNPHFLKSRAPPLSLLPASLLRFTRFRFPRHPSMRSPPLLQTISQGRELTLPPGSPWP